MSEWLWHLLDRGRVKEVPELCTELLHFLALEVSTGMDQSSPFYDLYLNLLDRVFGEQSSYSTIDTGKASLILLSTRLYGPTLQSSSKGSSLAERLGISTQLFSPSANSSNLNDMNGNNIKDRLPRLRRRKSNENIFNSPKLNRHQSDYNQTVSNSSNNKSFFQLLGSKLVGNDNNNNHHKLNQKKNDGNNINYITDIKNGLLVKRRHPLTKAAAALTVLLSPKNDRDDIASTLFHVIRLEHPPVRFRFNINNLTLRSQLLFDPEASGEIFSLFPNSSILYTELLTMPLQKLPLEPSNPSLLLSMLEYYFFMFFRAAAYPQFPMQRSRKPSMIKKKKDISIHNIFLNAGVRYLKDDSPYRTLLYDYLEFYFPSFNSNKNKNNINNNHNIMTMNNNNINNHHTLNDNHNHSNNRIHNNHNNDNNNDENNFSMNNLQIENELFLRILIDMYFGQNILTYSSPQSSQLNNNPDITLPIISSIIPNAYQIPFLIESWNTYLPPEKELLLSILTTIIYFLSDESVGEITIINNKQYNIRDKYNNNNNNINNNNDNNTRHRRKSLILNDISNMEIDQFNEDQSNNYSSMPYSLQLFQRPLFDYLLLGFKLCPLHSHSDSFPLLVDIWLTWICPWNAPDLLEGISIIDQNSKNYKLNNNDFNMKSNGNNHNNHNNNFSHPHQQNNYYLLRGAVSMKKKYNDEWRAYVIENYYFYSVLLGVFMERIKSLDHSLIKRSSIWMDLLDLVLSVYTPELVDLLETIDCTFEIEQSIFSMNSDGHGLNFQDSLQDYEVSLLCNHQTLLGHACPQGACPIIAFGDIATKVLDLLAPLVPSLHKHLLKPTKEIENDATMKKHLKSLCSYSKNAKTRFLQWRAEEISINIRQLFLISDNYIPKTIPTVEEILNQKNKIKKSFNNNEKPYFYNQIFPDRLKSLKSFLNLNGKLQVLSGFRSCLGLDVGYIGDPMYAPLCSYEIKWLTKALVLLSEKLNQIFKLGKYKLLNDDNDNTKALEKKNKRNFEINEAFHNKEYIKSSKFMKKAIEYEEIKDLGFRFNLRYLGDFRNIFFIIVCVFLLWLLYQIMIYIINMPRNEYRYEYDKARRRYRRVKIVD